VKEHQKTLTGESLVYGLGQALSRGVQMLLVPVLTRAFSPASYGVVDLLGLVGAVASLLTVMGTDAALARMFYDQSDGEARRTMVSSSALWRVGVCLALAAALALAAPALSHFVFASPDYAKYVRITAATIPFTAFFLFQNDVLRVTFQPWKFIALNLVNTVLVTGLSILFVVVWKRDVAGVLDAKLAGDAVTAALGFVLIRHSLVRRFDGALLKRMIRYGAPLIPSALAYWLMQYADRWVLGRFFGLDDVGVYAVSVKIGAAMLLAVSAFQLAWGPFAFARARAPEARALFSRVLTLYVAVATSIALALGLVAPDVLAWLVPPAYHAAAAPGALLAFASVAYGAYYVAGLGVTLAFRTDVLIWTSGAAALVAVALDVLLARPLGLLGVATATLSGFAGSTVLLYVVSQRIHPLPYRGLRALALYALGLVALAAGLGLQARLGPGIAGTGARAAVFVAYVALAAFLARRLPPPDVQSAGGDAAFAGEPAAPREVA
jgi:O-antigen/teichoic acid export membrane protein